MIDGNSSTLNFQNFCRKLNYIPVKCKHLFLKHRYIFDQNPRRDLPYRVISAGHVQHYEAPDFRNLLIKLSAWSITSNTSGYLPH